MLFICFGFLITRISILSYVLFPPIRDLSVLVLFLIRIYFYLVSELCFLSKFWTRGIGQVLYGLGGALCYVGSPLLMGGLANMARSFPCMVGGSPTYVGETTAWLLPHRMGAIPPAWGGHPRQLFPPRSAIPPCSRISDPCCQPIRVDS